jgi:hypothetical protein
MQWIETLGQRNVVPWMMVMEERLTADSAMVGVCRQMVGLGDYAKSKICT